MVYFHQTYAVYPTSYNVSHKLQFCPCACTVLCDGWSSLCAPSLSDSPTLCPHSALARFLGGFSARGWSSAVTRTALKYALRSLFVIDDVSGSEAVGAAGAGSVSVAVLSVSCASGTRNLWPPVPSARARARASERRL
eukprot:scaffold16659_cov70-Phaeocystis_antarctica.AAC.2